MLPAELSAIGVSPDSLLGLRSHRFDGYADTPVRFGLLLERAPSAFRLYDHGVVTESCDEVSTAAGWAAWARRLSRAAGVSTDETFCRGFQAMIEDSRALEPLVPKAARPLCPICPAGHGGLRCGASDAGGGGGGDDAGVSPGAVGVGLLAATRTKQFGEAARRLFRPGVRDAHFGRVAPSATALHSTLQFFDDNGYVTDGHMIHGDAHDDAQLERDVETALAKHSEWVDEHGDEGGEHDDEGEPAHVSEAGKLGVLVGVGAVEAAWLLVLVVLFNTVLIRAGTMTRAVNTFRAVWRPINGVVQETNRLKATRRFVSEAAFHHLVHTARHGSNTWYQGPMIRRVETPLSSARDHSKHYWEKVWELTKSGKMFVFTNSIAAGFETISSPIGAVAKALNSALKTLKMRFFHHLSKRERGVCPNEQTDKSPHGGIFYPTPLVPIRGTVMYKRKYPGSRVLYEVKDAEGAFTLLDTAAPSSPPTCRLRRRRSHRPSRT